MGAEPKQEQAPVEPEANGKADENSKPPVEEKREEQLPVAAKEKKNEQEKPPAEEENKEEEKPPPPPPPFVLYVDLHCVGCAKKIERSIMKIRGVEGVWIDMGENKVTVKGVVEAQAVCDMIMKKTKRSAKVLSPLPANEGEPMPQVVTSQVSGLTTVDLNVNMHCQACAAQLKKKILKMRGVQTAETELSSGQVTVTGTMDADKLVEYVYRRTKKQARIVPQPEPGEPKPELDNPDQPKDQEGDQEKPAEEGPKEGELGDAAEDKEEGGMDLVEEENMKRMMYHYYNYQQPLYYVVERIPPPQLFSDENPNACCIS